MPFSAATGTYTAASGATSASPGNIIFSATWNSVFTDIQTALTQLGQGTFAPPTTSVTLVNGLNSNITLPATLRASITGPTGAFSIGGFTGGADGKRLYIFNTTSQAMTLVNEDVSSTAANRIKTLAGQNIILQSVSPSPSFATMSYDGATARWIVESVNETTEAFPGSAARYSYSCYAVAVKLSVTSDTQITIPLPTGTTNYGVINLRLANLLGPSTGVGVGLYTAAGQTGTTIITSTAVTIVTSTAGAANTSQIIVPSSANTTMFNNTPLFFCVIAGNSGAAATIDAILDIQPLY